MKMSKTKDFSHSIIGFSVRSICYSDADMKTRLNFTLSAVWHEGQDEYQNSRPNIHQFIFFRVKMFFHVAALDKSPNFIRSQLFRDHGIPRPFIQSFGNLLFSVLHALRR